MSPSTARSVARPASTRILAALIAVAHRAALEHRVIEVDPAVQERPLARPAQHAGLGEVAVDPETAPIDGRPAARAIATLASVARNASRCAVIVGLVA